MKHPDRDDELNELFSRLRETPPVADPVRTATGFETRVLARIRSERAPDTARWFWRWSAVFGVAATVCAVLVVQNYLAMTDDAFATLGDGPTLLDFFY